MGKQTGGKYMIVCIKCKKEMTCIKTGLILRWHGSHCYASDAFECKECGAVVANTSENSFYNNSILSNVLEMDNPQSVISKYKISPMANQDSVERGCPFDEPNCHGPSEGENK
jgi:hypothetical protein